MAVLLVAMTVMAVMMTVAMPVWKQMSQREKEAELVFRGLQYARAIELMQRKMPGALPPNIDILVTQKFLRKKYKDPITGLDFDTVTPAQAVAPAAPGAQPPAGRGGATGPPGTGRSNTPATPPTAPVNPGAGAARPGAVAGGTQGGIIGVVSKSKETSIRLYNGRSHYNEWIFQAIQRTQAPGGGAPGSGTPGQPTPGGRGGRGQPPGGGRGGPGMPPPSGRGPAPPGRP